MNISPATRGPCWIMRVKYRRWFVDSSRPRSPNELRLAEQLLGTLAYRTFARRGSLNALR